MDRHEIEAFEQNRIAELMDRLSEYGRTIKDECRKLRQIEKGSQEEYVVWDRLEVLSTYIAGYVSQVTTKGYL